MSDASQFFGSAGVHPTGAALGTLQQTVQTYNVAPPAIDYISGVSVVATGALTANTLATVLSVSGKGALSLLTVASASVAVRTHRIKVTLDGVVILDGTAQAGASLFQLYTPVGQVISSDPVNAGLSWIPEVLHFNTSLLIEYASSLTETAKTKIGYRCFPT